ncbi:ATP-dependent Clp protease proteolytic subunit [Anaerotruncus massiliensis (ex Togo et al. 2019)]|uniref:ATP-dependent Clp protease proteolytic subunit n=1 Tax=Anaerotruncus massiliensis (ex Togo et al. 2019) TaxID=1673720 RepID=UPI0023F0580F|nr:ATP-dependent Clp protease proteolytic subunit [Anaerotruncus massiliensis (ex Togo et al. 2019)]
MKTSNTPRLYAGPQVVHQTPTKFWNVASVSEDEGEIVLYGDVVARQPVDWWTGEPEPGLYIAPESFMEDLAAVKGKSNITIKINSCGGDLYHAKTGIEVDQLRSMMTRETWMVGQEAVDNGFADTLLEGDGPDVSVSADKQVLLVAGIRHNIKGLHNVPSTIRINSIHAAPAAGNKPTGNGGENRKEDEPMTLEEMRAQHPDLVAQIEQQAVSNAIAQERARIEAIDSIAASVGDAQLVRDAKYGENTCTAEQLALKAMQKQAALGTKHLKDAATDSAESGAADVGAAPNGGEEGSETDDKAKVDAIVGLYNTTKNGGKK